MSSYGICIGPKVPKYVLLLRPKYLLLGYMEPLGMSYLPDVGRSGYLLSPWIFGSLPADGMDASTMIEKGTDGQACCNRSGGCRFRLWDLGFRVWDLRF